MADHRPTMSRKAFLSLLEQMLMFHLTPSESRLDQSLLTCFESLTEVAASEFRFNGTDALLSTKVPGCARESSERRPLSAFHSS